MILCKNCFEEYEEHLGMCHYCGYEEGDEADEPFILKPGSILNNRYVIGQKRGLGGFGITYKAWDMQTNMVLAVKEYYLASCATRQQGTQDVIVNAEKNMKEFLHFKNRFLEEARCTAKFNQSNNIVNVYDFFEEHNTAYMVMEYLDGISLDKLMETRQLTMEETIYFINKITEALVDVHKANIIHRDISPDNVFLLKNGKIKLYDFGAARLSLQNDALTRVVKRGFAPIEQYRSDKVQGPWTDIYALGATAYYILTGVKPIESTDREAQKVDPLPSPMSLNPNIPEGVNNAILRAMSVEIPLRFQNLDEFSQALNGTKVIRDVVAERKLRKLKRAVSLALACFVLFVGTYVALNVVLNDLKSETLPDSTIQIWCELPDDEQSASSKTTAMQQIISTFNNSYPNVEIEIQYYNSDTYSEAIAQAYEDDALPTLFESTDIDDEILDKTLNVTDAISLLTGNEILLFTNDETNYNFNKQFPTGFIIEIKYTNTNVDKISNSTDYETQKDAFLNFALEEFYGTSADYMDIQNTLPAQFEMTKADETKISAQYTNFWSIGECDDDEYKSATRLLAFFMSDNAQDNLHIQYFDNVLPLNYQTLTQSYIVTFDDFSYFFENIDEIVFN